MAEVAYSDPSMSMSWIVSKLSVLNVNVMSICLLLPMSTFTLLLMSDVHTAAKEEASVDGLCHTFKYVPEFPLE